MTRHTSHAVDEIDFSLEIVIPVRNMAEHLSKCLITLSSQICSNDKITVVNDGSTDATTHVATMYGASVIETGTQIGPYAARNLAADASDCDGILFVDARSRARVGLLQAHREILHKHPHAMSCTDVVTVGDSFAARVAALQDIFSLERYIGQVGRLDYFPTMNLGVRRSAFQSVGGFKADRTGGDADLCWRIQAAGLGTLGVQPKVLMEWEARDSLVDLTRQWFRYGQGASALSETSRAVVSTTARRSAHKGPAERLKEMSRRDLLATLVVVGLHGVYLLGQLRNRVSNFRGRSR